MPSDDLLDHAKSKEDFYALLGPDLHPGSSSKEISRSYRLSSLKVHPDKNKSPDAVAKFHALTIAYEVLSDETAKAIYDGARMAREARKRQDELFSGRRKAMKEDLEARERAAFGGGFGNGGAKRRRGSVEEEAEVREREIKRLAEEGRRRRLEKEEALRKVREEEEAAREAEAQQATFTAPQSHTQSHSNGPSSVPESDRTVKVRWPREGRGLSIDKEELTSLFGIFGPIEMVIVLKDKKVRPTMGSEEIGELKANAIESDTPSKQRKRLMATGVIIFKSIVGAHAAVLDFKRQRGEAWEIIESVEWRDREPDLGSFGMDGYQSTSNGQTAPTASTTNPQAAQSHSRPPTQQTPSTPTASTLRDKVKTFAQQQSNGTPISPFTTKLQNDINNNGNNNLRKVPSFASFKATGSTPAGTPSKLGAGIAGSPSFEEATLMRMKEFERRKLERQIREKEAAEVAAGTGD